MLEYGCAFGEGTEQVIQRVEDKFDHSPTPKTPDSGLERVTDAVADELGVESHVAKTLTNKINHNLACLRADSKKLEKR